MPTIFITGIDTDAGKTIATGLLARYLMSSGYSAITQKIVQTGCDGFSEDIRLHRQLMGIAPTEVDEQGLTCPYLFKLPASPHLAARQEHTYIEPERRARATAQLEQQYEYVLIEGVGGIYVPLNDSMTVLDYIAKHNYPVILVSNAKLGSINHTLLTLEALSHRYLNLMGIIYNEYPPENPLITEDSKQIFIKFLRRFRFKNALIPIPKISFEDEIPEIDFAKFFLTFQICS